MAGVIFLQQNDEWAVCRRNMSLETIAKLCQPADSDPLEIAAE